LETLFISTLGTLLLLGTDFFLKPQVISGLGTALPIISFMVDNWERSVRQVMFIGLLGEQLLAILLACWGAISGWQKHRNIIISWVFGF